MTKKQMDSFLYRGFALFVFSLSMFGISMSQSSAAEQEIDATYLMEIDFDAYDMEMRVQAITEDADWYYVEYTYAAVEIVDASWQRLPKASVMKIAKGELGSRDLGLYVADQLDQIVRQQRGYVKEMQAKERDKESERTAVNEYAGLVGQPLKSEEKAFDGYQPVKPPVEDTAGAVVGVASASAANSSIAAIIPSTSIVDELSSKIDMLEGRLQTLSELVAAITEFYTTFDPSSFVRKGE